MLESLLLGVLLEPLEPLLPELEPMPLLLGVLLEPPLLLGELLLGVLLLGVLLLGVLLLPELEPDLLKCASHSAFDTCPSLFLSTEVKLGALELAPPDAPDAPLELLPEALGEELDPDALGVELDPEELGVELDPEAPDEPLELLPLALGEDLDLSVEDLSVCAMDTLASANSAAAVAVVISFNFIWWFLLQKVGKDCSCRPMQHSCLRRTQARVLGCHVSAQGSSACRLDHVWPPGRLRLPGFTKP